MSDSTEEVTDPVADDPSLRKGAISWMARNGVAANLLMAGILACGILLGLLQVKQEVFPEFSLDIITVRVPYPGASPEEVEQGIVLAVEEEVRGIDGVKAVDATAAEGYGVVSVELLLGDHAHFSHVSLEEDGLQQRAELGRRHAAARKHCVRRCLVQLRGGLWHLEAAP